MIPFPKKKYSVIYADPPWSYAAGGKKRNVTRHYHTMKPEDIYDLPVQDIAADDCLLFMWATFPNLEIALETIRRWGFKYRFNIILNLTEPKNDLSGRFPRNYYPPDMVDQVIEDILAGVEAKRARYRDYEKTVADAKAKVAHERGFWQQARPVKKKRGKDNDHI